MKCWKVTLNDCDIAYVLAESPGKATAKAINEAAGWDGTDWWEIEWKQVRRRREPTLDGETLTERQLIECGLMWTECAGCGEQIAQETLGVAGGDYTRDVDVVWTDGGAPFCSRECLEKALAANPMWNDHLGPTFDPTDCVLLSTEY